VAYANPATLEKFKIVMESLEHNLPISCRALDDWEDVLIISRDLRIDDLLVVLSARKNTISYNKLFEKIPRQLSKYFQENSILLLYPEQFS
jgi:hypothetical protein